MYNGIGLPTPRGSGTSGYVQRNFAAIKNRKEKVDYKTDAELAKLDRSLNKPPNKEILEHQWKRRIELKCVELQDELEEQGCVLTCCVNIQIMVYTIIFYFYIWNVYKLMDNHTVHYSTWRNGLWKYLHTQ